MDDDDVEEEEELNFSGQDWIKIRDAVVLLIQSLLRLLQTFPLRDRPQSASNFAKVTAFCQHSQVSLKHLHAWYLILFPLKVFSKLLYFEPVVGQLSFAPVQWVVECLHLSFNKKDAFGDIDYSVCVGKSQSWRVCPRWLSMACNYFVCQNMETRKK